MTTSAPIAPPLAAPLSASQLAAATPAKRDRYVDFLRVASLAIVILGHWLMAAVVWSDGRLSATNVLETTPDAVWLTWVFQIMPVFFLVGGFSNSASWDAARRKNSTYGTWLGSRLTRLVRPVLVFAGVWMAGLSVVGALGLDPAAVRASSIAQPLWFLAVYVAVIALAPAMVDAQRRWGGAVLLLLATAVAAVDLARWPLGLPLIGWANLGLVWLFAHQLGVAWRSGAVSAWSRRQLGAVALAALGVVVVLTQAGGYPRSMVGGIGEVRSNTFPPSLALVALATWQFGVLLVVRPFFDRWLARPRAWAAVVAANGIAMTVYLWHLTALVLVAVMTLPGAVLPQPTAGSVAWWAWKPVWIVLASLALLPLVALFSRFEVRAPAPTSPSRFRSLMAAAAVAAGMAMLARKGFAGTTTPWEFPVVGTTLLAAAWITLRRTPRAAKNASR